jgi:outer membrane murein-binding lipoprotein Lpp
MAFTIEDVQDLIRLLAERPEWRAQLRPLILGDEFERLPRIVEELAEAQRRTEARVGELVEAQQRTEARVEELAEAQRRTEARVEELAEAQRRTEARVEELAEAQRRTEARVEELAEAQRRTEARVDTLAERIERLAEGQERLGAQLAQLTARVDALVTAVEAVEWSTQRAHQRLDAEVGYLYEMRFERRAPGLFGRWMRRPRVVTLSELELLDRAEDEGKFSEKDLEELRALDLIVEGRDRGDGDQATLLLAVEVSRTIEANDIERALARARLLERAGYRAKPAVGGREIDDRVRLLADASGVLVRTAELEPA